MTKSPWGGPPVTGTPLDYVPISAPLGAGIDIPDRPSRLVGYYLVFGALIIGVLLGAVLV
ncbi:hypothetical protein [Neorhizobium sp. JUb45]|uniref:hypothetical protein n=1 Tax=Neorhizobium sp. JUb45 TaxID=2485113 RepID=UPI001044056B|nr:hypothetical protein [Neorhizobium sp. JUb45]TCR07225.1 hypothetical protein EDF70_1011196 [Neorhizobium sp. JUb45]